MVVYYTILTNNKEKLSIRKFYFTDQQGKTVCLTADEMEESVEKDLKQYGGWTLLHGRWKGVYIDNDYANGRLDELKDLCLCGLSIGGCYAAFRDQFVLHMQSIRLTEGSTDYEYPEEQINSPFTSLSVSNLHLIESLSSAYSDNLRERREARENEDIITHAECDGFRMALDYVQGLIEKENPGSEFDMNHQSVVQFLKQGGCLS